jgi:hypothetical protein
MTGADPRPAVVLFGVGLLTNDEERGRTLAIEDIERQ